jgi:hypothetical protein
MTSTAPLRLMIQDFEYFVANNVGHINERREEYL